MLVSVLAPAGAAEVSTVGARSPEDTGDTSGGRAPLLIFGVAVGVGESDNVTLAPTDRLRQTIAAADVDFTVKDQSRLIDLDAVGQFTYLDYLQHAYNSQLTGRFDGQAQFAIIPQRVSWVVRDDFGQAAIDPYSAVTPSNTEDVNYFSTGPDLFVHLGDLNFVNMSARYARTQYQTSPYDSNRGLANLSVGREISAAASVSVDANVERVLFADTRVNSDFDRTALFGRYQLNAARTEFVGDLGGSRIRESDGSSAGALVRLTLSRALSAASKLTLTAGREPTDAASSFSTPSGSIAGIVAGAVPAAISSGSYTKDYASAEWRFVRNRTSMSLLTTWERDSYVDRAALDVKRSGADLIIERRLTHAITAELRGGYRNTDYPNAAVATSTASSNYADWRLGSALIWRLGRVLEMRLRYDHTVRSVAEGGGAYGDDRVFFTVGYRPTPLTED